MKLGIEVFSSVRRQLTVSRKQVKGWSRQGRMLFLIEDRYDVGLLVMMVLCLRCPRLDQGDRTSLYLPWRVQVCIALELGYCQAI